MTMNSLNVFCISGCWRNRSYATCLPFEKAFSEILCIIREGGICTQRRTIPWNISGSEMLAKGWITPCHGKAKKETEEQICMRDVRWLGYQHPWIFTDCLETPTFKLPSAIAHSQLPSGAGAPTLVTHHHPSSQRAPWRPSTDSGNPSTVTLVSDNKGNLCPWSGSCCGTSVLGMEEGKKKKGLFLEV